MTIHRPAAPTLLVLLALVASCGPREPEPSPAARERVAEAVVAESEGDWNRALAALEAARAADPAQPLASLEQGRLLERMGFLSESVAAYEDAARRAPRSARAWLALALLYRRAGRDALFSHSVDAAVAADARDPETLLARARVQLARGDLWAASKAIGEALEARPNDGDALALLGALERRRDALGVAAEALQRAVEMDPGNREARLELGALYADVGRSRDALAVLEPARRERETPELLEQMAALYRRTNQSAEGAAFEARVAPLREAEQRLSGLRERLWTAPRDSGLRRELAVLLLERGDALAAEGVYRGWLRVEPGNADAQAGAERARATASGAASSTPGPVAVAPVSSEPAASGSVQEAPR